MTQWGLDNLFNPGKRHMDDEKRRLQSTREEIGDNSGGRRIDLEGGKVSISVPRSARATADEPADAAADAPVDAPADPPIDLDAALEAEDVPALALESDESEIEPALVDEAVPTPTPAPAPTPTVAAPASADPEPAAAVSADPEPAAAAPDVEPEPEPVPAIAAPKRRGLSANAWSRRG